MITILENSEKPEKSQKPYFILQITLPLSEKVMLNFLNLVLYYTAAMRNIEVL